LLETTGNNKKLNITMANKPLLSAPKKPNPTRTVQCLMDLLDKNVGSKRKRNEAKDGRVDSGKQRFQQGSSSSSLPSRTTTAAAMTGAAAKKKPTITAVVDVFGGINSGSFSLLGLVSSAKTKTANTKGLRLQPAASSLVDSTKHQRSQPTATMPNLSSKPPTGVSIQHSALLVKASTTQLVVGEENAVIHNGPTSSLNPKESSTSSQSSSTVVLAKKRKILPLGCGYVVPKIRPPPPSSYYSSSKTSAAAAVSKTDAMAFGKQLLPNDVAVAANNNFHNTAAKKKATMEAQPFRMGTFVQSLSLSSSTSSSSRRRPKRDLKQLAVHTDPPPDGDETAREGQYTILVQELDNNTCVESSTSMHAPSVQPPDQPVKRISALDVMPLLTDAANHTATAASARARNNKPKENFVRLNLRNTSGACRGSRKSSTNKKLKYRKSSTRFAAKNKIPGDETIDAAARLTTVEGIDPVDDFIDGTFAPKTDDTTTKKQRQATTMHLCKGHQEPCKLLKVKKTGPNKGRQFYVCPCPRSEQCDHFQWADDTQQVCTLLGSATCEEESKRYSLVIFT
jgi:GRF zinc finger